MAKSIVALKYNPCLSVAENAKRCRVSASAIRKYIRVNAIDRNFDNKVAKQKAILTLKEKNPAMSLAEMARRLGYSVNTIKKYLALELESSKIATSKVSTFDVAKNVNNIKSFSFSQNEILSNILLLYINAETFECDLTYSIGAFYRHFPQPKLKFDKYPQHKGVQPLDEAYHIPNSSLSSIVCDLPFIVRGFGKENNAGQLVERFDYFTTAEDAYKANLEMINLAYNKLKRGGYFIMKSMDVRCKAHSLWLNAYIQVEAMKLGFVMEDLFILAAKSRMLYYRGVKQNHARKYHSYFFVFRKGNSMSTESVLPFRLNCYRRNAVSKSI